VIKTYYVEFTIPAGSAWRRLQSLITPAGKTRKVLEVRPYFSAGGDARIRIYHETELVYEISPDVDSTFKLPYPGDVTVPAGTGLYFEGMNSTASNVTVKVELVVDETT